jgi:hypothetical protein
MNAIRKEERKVEVGSEESKEISVLRSVTTVCFICLEPRETEKKNSDKGRLTTCLTDGIII